MRNGRFFHKAFSSMASVQKRFLKCVKKAWHQEFPFLKSIDVVEVPRLPKGSNFVCDKYLSERGRVYFVWFDFSQKRVGEFGVGISVSDTPSRCVRDPGLNKPSPEGLGIYDVGQFGSPKRTWALVDVNAELAKVFTSLGADTNGFLPPRPQSTWFPTGFELTEGEVFSAAVADIGMTLTKFVFPTLQIEHPVSPHEQNPL